jgi:small subunit ribosomal protein S5
MDTEIKTTEQITATGTTVIPVLTTSAPIVAAKSFSKDSRPPRGGRRPQRPGQERVKPEFDTKIIAIRRVTRVASGGRKFTFSVAVVSGDRKGKVGVGLGKAGDTSLAIDKATRNAKKNMIKVTLSPAMTIPHMVEAKFSSARVMIMPARGRGVVAGSAVRTVIEHAGIKDVCAKLLSGSKNKLNIARVTINALQKLSRHPRTTK